MANSSNFYKAMGYSKGGETLPITTLLDAIAQAESEAYGGYNAIYKYKDNPHNLTQMTVDEILQLQKKMIKNSKRFGNSPMGRYQFKHSTLKEMVDKGYVKPDDIFDEKTQDKLAIKKLQDRGFQEFVGGKLSPEDYIYNISQEWAGLPKDSSGLSYYSGVGNNKANIAYDHIYNTVLPFQLGTGQSYPPPVPPRKPLTRR